MHITDEMLKIAVTKSVEAGLLPRRALKEDFLDAQEIMRMILQSALSELSYANTTQSTKKSSGASTACQIKKSMRLPIELHNYQ